MLPRILAVLIIGGGFIIWRMIFRRYPLNNLYNKKPILQWSIAFLIIIGQLYYIWLLLSRLFSY